MLVNPPWIYTAPLVGIDGNQPLRITATDLVGNTATYEFTIRTDAGGPTITLADDTLAACADPFACPEYSWIRRLHVTAADASTVAGMELFVDGTRVGTTTSSDETWVQTFATAGNHEITARARDGLDQVSEKTMTVLIDDQAPTIPPPAITESTVDDGAMLFDFCPQDASAMSRKYVFLDIDGVRAPATTVSTNASCFRTRAENVRRGSHSWTIHVSDRWGNKATRAGTMTVERIPPTLTKPTITKFPNTPTTVRITTTITAQYGIDWIDWTICLVPAEGGTCVLHSVKHIGSAGDYTKAYADDMPGLTPGKTYVARMEVAANNTRRSSVTSDPFTIPIPPPPPPVVFDEIEPNSIPPNTVASNTQQIRGTYNPGPIHPVFWVRRDTDFFRIAVPAGKTLHLRSNFHCVDPTYPDQVPEIFIGRIDPFDGTTSSDGYDKADGSIAFDVPAWSSSYGGSATIVEISVWYMFGGNTSCPQPAYALNLSID